MEASYSNLHKLYDDIKSGDNKKIVDATVALECLQQKPGFCENLLDIFVVNTEDETYQIFITILIKNQIKNNWKNEKLYKDKNKFRKNLLVIMINSSGVLLFNISEIIVVIASFDFPVKWPQLVFLLTNLDKLDNAKPRQIYSILYTTSQILERCRIQKDYGSLPSSKKDFIEILLESLTTSHSLFSQDGMFEENMVNQNIKLLTNSKLRENPVFDDCLYYCFEINRKLCSSDTSANYTQLFDVYHYYLNQNGYEKIKILICKILKLLVIYNSSISEQLIYDLFNTLNFYVNSAKDSIFNDEIICECFITFSSIIRSPCRSFFAKKDVFEDYCNKILVPCSFISDDDIYDFYNNPLVYLENNYVDIGSCSRRFYAKGALTDLQRKYKKNMIELFTITSSKSIENYTKNPDETFKFIDSLIFIMRFLIPDNYFLGEVRTVYKDFDLNKFINTFIIPLIWSKQPIVQSSALNFLAEYRNVIDDGTILKIFPNIINSICVEGSPISSYVSYFIEKIFSAPNYSDKFNTLFQSIDIHKFIQYLIKLGFDNNKTDKFNPFDAKCLMRIVAFGKENIKDDILEIVQKCFKTLTDSYMLVISYPNYCHCLFEIIVAAVSKDKISVHEIENYLFELLDKTKSNEMLEFMPYIYQVIACFILYYPDDTLTKSDSKYVTNFPIFIEDQQWHFYGNCSALSILIRTYCIKMNTIIIDNIDSIINICDFLIKETKTHPLAIDIFLSIIRFLPKDFVYKILPRIYTIIFSHLNDDNLIGFGQSFVVFMSETCFFLDCNALKLLGSNAEMIVSCWAKNMNLIRGRKNLESTIEGSLKTLFNSSVLSNTMFENLLIGVLNMLEKPSFYAIRNEIEIMKNEEQISKEFNVNFNKLVYLGDLQNKSHPELQNKDLVEYFASKLAIYQKQNPNHFPDVIRKIKPILRNYEKRYGLKFD